jgi:hypothetical protein
MNAKGTTMATEATGEFFRVVNRGRQMQIGTVEGRELGDGCAAEVNFEGVEPYIGGDLARTQVRNAVSFLLAERAALSVDLDCGLNVSRIRPADLAAMRARGELR